jgi:hypothetical protein
MIRPPSLDLSFLAGVLDPHVAFARASPGAYIDPTGVLQVAGNNIPRFDYDQVSHACLGLLIEDVATNLVLNSATLVTQSVTATRALQTLSFWGNGSVALSGVYTGNLVGVNNATRVMLSFTPASAGALTLTVTGRASNAQLELGNLATSYIATTGVTASRAKDIPGSGANTSYLTPGAGTAVLTVNTLDNIPANVALDGSPTHINPVMDLVAATPFGRYRRMRYWKEILPPVQRQQALG